MKKFFTVIGILLIVAIAVIWVALNKPANQSSSTLSENFGSQGEKVPILDRGHVLEGTKVATYNSNPPTSGSHWPQPADWGFYDESLPDEALVHNLEHGGIWISYKDADETVRQEGKAIASLYNQAVVVTLRPENDSAVAVASWGRLLKLDQFDKDRVDNFIKANVNNSPEKFASLEKAKVARNLSAPEATFTTFGGDELTLSEFKDKKVMFWLLATWCQSCVAGAQALAQNNDKLGNLTIIALETYGNAGYPGPSMEAFARENAPQVLSASNWLWGNAPKETTNTYNPHNYPDIFFLIDEKGVVKEINGAPAATINTIIQFANE